MVTGNVGSLNYTSRKKKILVRIDRFIIHNFKLELGKLTLSEILCLKRFSRDTQSFPLEYSK